MTVKEIVSRISLDPKTNCWIWDGALQSRGYGHVRIRGINRLVHKIVYESFKGPVSKGLTLDHLCRVKRCCNPQHLEPVTSQENRKRVPRKTHCGKGHSFEKEGFYLKNNGGRECKRCVYERKNKGGDSYAS